MLANFSEFVENLRKKNYTVHPSIRCPRFVIEPDFFANCFVDENATNRVRAGILRFSNFLLLTRFVALTRFLTKTRFVDRLMSADCLFSINCNQIFSNKLFGGPESLFFRMRSRNLLYVGGRFDKLKFIENMSMIN